MEIKIFNFEPHGDSRGQLIALEENKDIPFDIKRVYYMMIRLLELLGAIMRINT